MDTDNESVRIRMAEGGVNEKTGSIPQLVITPVEICAFPLDCTYQCSTPKDWISLSE